jgi:tetratricopeptide (TPR) repeat protein
MRRLYPWLIVCLLLVSAGRLSAQTNTDNCPPLPLGLTGDAYTYYVGVGDANAARGQSSAALLAYSCAIDAQPDYAPAYARRGLAQTVLGDADAAIADFNRALDRDEMLLEAYINRGIFYTRAGNYALAIGDFTLVVSLDPQNTLGLQNRAMVHAIEGNFDLALDDLNQAINFVPDEPDLYAARAAIYSAYALQDYQRFLDASGDPKAALPAGAPGEVLAAVDNSLRSGSVDVWVTLLRAGQ